MPLLSAIRGIKNFFNSPTDDSDPFSDGFADKKESKNLLLQLDKDIILAFYLTKCANGISHESDQMQMTVEKIQQGIYRQAKLNTACVIETAVEYLLNGTLYPAGYIIFDNRKSEPPAESAVAIELPTNTSENKLIDKYCKKDQVDQLIYAFPISHHLVVDWIEYDAKMNKIVDIRKSTYSVNAIQNHLKYYKKPNHSFCITLVAAAMLSGKRHGIGQILYDDRPMSIDAAKALLNTGDNEKKESPVTHVKLDDLPKSLEIFVTYTATCKDNSRYHGTLKGIPEHIAIRLAKIQENYLERGITSFQATLAATPIVGDPRFPKDAIIYERPKNEFPVVELTEEQKQFIFYDTDSSYRIISVESNCTIPVLELQLKKLNPAIRTAQAMVTESKYMQILVCANKNSLIHNAVVWDSRNKRPVS